MLEELWNKNLVNIFAAPLKLGEWVISFMIMGVVKAAISLIFAAVLAFLLYKVKIFMYGFGLLPILMLLIISGWAVGFLIAGIVLRFGTKVQTLAWSLVYVFAPFSAIYYPISVLPEWAQAVSRIIPMSYIFEAARKVVATGRLDYSLLLPALLLNLLYLSLTLAFFRASFRSVLQKGLRSVY
jgi:ABC-2 type transport system permease protein